MTMITESQGTARPLAPTGIFATLVGFVATYRSNRRALQDLAAMEDYLLRDIGLSRDDVMRAAGAEFGADRMAMLDHARSRGMAR
jgi:uncharacterized protein YjiS (DUF1127 family)